MINVLLPRCNMVDTDNFEANGRALFPFSSVVLGSTLRLAHGLTLCRLQYYGKTHAHGFPFSSHRGRLSSLSHCGRLDGLVQTLRDDSLNTRGPRSVSTIPRLWVCRHGDGGPGHQSHSSPPWPSHGWPPAHDHAHRSASVATIRLEPLIGIDVLFPQFGLPGLCPLVPNEKTKWDNGRRKHTNRGHL